MTNNNGNRLEKLKPLIKLNQNDFIFVQIFQRRKDNPELELSRKRLKAYTFYSWEDLEKSMDRIKEICDMNNARAYIRLNKQNAIDVSLRCIEKMSENIRKGLSTNNHKIWDAESGRGGSKDWWVLEINEEHMGLEGFIVEELNDHYKNRVDKDLADTKKAVQDLGFDITMNYTQIYPIFYNSTKTGMHIICKPFDKTIINKFNSNLSSKNMAKINVQEDGNTVLYIGKPQQQSTLKLIPHDSNSNQNKKEIQK